MAPVESLPYALPVLAALGGSVATSALSELRQWRRDRQQVRDLREGFKRELVQLESYPEQVEKLAAQETVSHKGLHALSIGYFPYFEANQDQLHRLTNIEQLWLTRVYGTLNLMEEAFGTTVERLREKDRDKDQTLRITGLRDVTTEFEEERHRALAEVRSHL